MDRIRYSLTSRLGAIRTTAIALIASIVLGGPALAAENWPDGPVQLIVSYGAGGGTDRQARLLAPMLEKELGVAVVVQNLPGAGGQVAATALLREKADGRTILATNQPDLGLGVVRKNAPYKTEDFQVIMADIYDPRVLLVRNNSHIKSFGDFVRISREKPGSISVSTSQGGAQELLAKWLFKALKIDVRLVGYKSGGRAAAGMVGEQVDSTLGDDFARFNIRDKSTALFIGGAKKSKRWPEAPTMVDALKPFGVTPPTPDFLARYGVYVVPSAFKKNHPDRYAKLQSAMIAATKAPAFKERIAKAGIEDLYQGAPGEDYADAFAKSTAAAKTIK